jgi:hypothetical protein
MRNALLVGGMLLVLFTASVIHAQTTVHDAGYRVVLGTEPPGVRVDWTAQAVFIITQAKAPVNSMGRHAYRHALEAAQAQARQQALAGFAEMNLTSYATLKETVITNVLPEDTVRAVSKAVRPVVDRWDAPTRTITLLSALPMVGSGTLGELAARMLKTEQQMYAVNSLSPVTPRERMTLRTITPVRQISAGPYTGLILDCSGLHYTPSLLPKFVAEDGAEFWGTLGVNRLLVMEKGVASFKTAFNNALSSDRVGETPLIIRPVGTAGKLRGDLVFTADDARLIMEQQTASRFLDGLHIVMVID